MNIHFLSALLINIPEKIPLGLNKFLYITEFGVLHSWDTTNVNIKTSILIIKPTGGPYDNNFCTQIGKLIWRQL